MRIRTVKPEFFMHAELSDIERISNVPIRLAFIGLWCACDREGRFKWDARRLGVQILPYDNIDFEIILDILHENSFIEKYEVDGKTYGCVPSFHRHQVINNREQESYLPSYHQPDLFSSDLTRVNTGESTCDDACSGEGKGKEGRKGRGKEEIEMDLPFKSEKFAEAWDMWLGHRREKKKRLTKSTATMQLKAMEEIGEFRAIAMINYSIKNGWTGLFEDQSSNVTPIQRKPQTSDQYGI
jgi:hypothetical protein